MINVVDLFFFVAIVYLVNSILYLINITLKNEKLEKFNFILTIIGFIPHTLGLVLWMKQVGHAPFTNLYESTVFFSWAIVLVYFLILLKYKIKNIGMVTVPLAFLAIGAASILPAHYKEMTPLVPALQSIWLEVHVISCMLAYSFFAFSFVMSIMFLVKQKNNSDKLPATGKLENLNHKSILIGIVLLTFGIISGSIWANSAWGTYWSWDPKETWSLITWIIYAIYLHARFVKGWSEKRLAYISCFGFLCVLFTYWGVNLLLSGLHSYGR